MWKCTIADVQLFKTIVYTLKQLSSECIIKCSTSGHITFQISTSKYFFEIECPISDSICSQVPITIDTRNLFTISTMIKNNDTVKLGYLNEEFVIYCNSKTISLSILDTYNFTSFTSEPTMYNPIFTMDSQVFSNVIKDIKSFSTSFDIVSDGDDVIVSSKFADNGINIKDFHLEIFGEMNKSFHIHQFTPLQKLLKRKYSLKIYNTDHQFKMMSSMDTVNFKYILFNND